MPLLSKKPASSQTFPDLGIPKRVNSSGRWYNRHCQVGVKRRGSAHDSFWRVGLSCVEADARRGISGAFLLFSDVFHAKLTMPARATNRGPNQARNVRLAVTVGNYPSLLGLPGSEFRY